MPYFHISNCPTISKGICYTPSFVRSFLVSALGFTSVQSPSQWKIQIPPQIWWIQFRLKIALDEIKPVHTNQFQNILSRAKMGLSGVDQKFKAWGGWICKDNISEVSSFTIVYNFALSCKIFPYLDASIPHICHERRERRACKFLAKCKKNTEERQNFTLNSV